MGSAERPAAKVYNCPGCGLPFKWPRAMRLHWRHKHGTQAARNAHA